jgi:hypothetical protein
MARSAEKLIEWPVYGVAEGRGGVQLRKLPPVLVPVFLLIPNIISDYVEPRRAPAFWSLGARQPPGWPHCRGGRRRRNVGELWRDGWRLFH